MSQFDFYPSSPLVGLKSQLEGLNHAKAECVEELGRHQQALLVTQEKLARIAGLRSGIERAMKILEEADENEKQKLPEKPAASDNDAA